MEVGGVGSDRERKRGEFGDRDDVGVDDRERGLEGLGAGLGEKEEKEGGGKIFDLLGH